MVQRWSGMTLMNLSCGIDMPGKPGLYSNIHKKRKRIKGGSGEKMRKVGSKGAPTAAAFKASAKTAKRPKKKK
jgi:hypothetical protein